jgi:RNA polymerase sigma-70 factor, ECF subfamily
VSTDLIDRARAGDEAAFQELVSPYQRELQVHCYRFLGCVADAEDALQETLVTAWRSLPGFEGRASIRTWLYLIATTRCLNLRRSASRRPAMSLNAGVQPPEPTRLGEVTWLEPYPDLLDELPDSAQGPEAACEAREAISLAFVTALQLLPPLQRATLTREQPPADTPAPPLPGSPAEQELVGRLVAAFEAADVDGIVSLMTEDAWLRMPPVPLEYQGQDLARRFFATVAFRHGRRHRLIPARANGQPAFGVYLHDPHSQVLHASGLLVITLAGERISAITRFDNSTLLRTLPS